MIQNKLKSIEDTICWINQEEALFKFPQSSYPDVGDVNVIIISLFSYSKFSNTVRPCYSGSPKKKGVLRPKVGKLRTKKFPTFFLSAL